MFGPFTQAFSAQFNAVSLGQEPIEDGIGHGGFVEVGVPLGDGELGDDNGAGPLVAVLEDLEQEQLDGVGDGLQAEVVEDQ